MTREQRIIQASADEAGAMGREALTDNWQPLGSVVESIIDKIDPRDPDPSRPGVFRDHNCWKCSDGKRPCAKGSPRNCGYLHARND